MSLDPRKRKKFLGPADKPWNQAYADSAITAGQVVRITGTTSGGAYFTVAPAIADGVQSGLLAVAATSANSGDRVWFQEATTVSLDTSAGAAGDDVYLSDTVAGTLTLSSTIEPVGWVSEAAVAGRVLVVPAAQSSGGGGGGTPLAYTKVGSASDGGALSLSLTVPAGVANNDLCVIAVIMRNGTVSSPPEGSGWTLDYSFDTESAEWLYVYSKVSTGTEPASWPITVTATTSLAIAGVVRGFSGAASAKRYSGAPDTFTVPSIPAKEGELIVCVGAQSVTAGASGIGIPSNGDWSDFLDEVIAAVNANDQAGSMSLQVFGATGPSFGFAFTSGGSVGFAQGVAVAYGV